MEAKREELKQMLAKKWKREKLVNEQNKDKKTYKDFQQAEKAELFAGRQQQKRTQDMKIQKQKDDEWRKKKEKVAQVAVNKV